MVEIPLVCCPFILYGQLTAERPTDGQTALVLYDHVSHSQVTTLWLLQSGHYIHSTDTAQPLISKHEKGTAYIFPLPTRLISLSYALPVKGYCMLDSLSKALLHSVAPIPTPTSQHNLHLPAYRP